MKSPSEKRFKKLEDEPSINIFDTDVYIKNDDLASRKRTSRHGRGAANYTSLKIGGEANKENLRPQFFNIGNLTKTSKFNKIVIGENIKQAAIKAHHMQYTADPTDPEHDAEKDKLLQLYAKNFDAQAKETEDKVEEESPEKPSRGRKESLKNKKDDKKDKSPSKSKENSLKEKQRSR